MAQRNRPRSGFSDFSAFPVSAKQRLEREIVRRREVESRNAETWRSNDKYFHHWNVQNEKFDEWTSPRSAQMSYRRDSEARRLNFVEERRARLKALYLNEKLKYEEEIKQRKDKEEKNKWELMKTKVEKFNVAKETEWRQLAEEDLHKQWRLNSPDFHDFQTRLKQQQLKDFWDLQRKGKEEQLRQEKWELEEKLRNAEIEQKKMAIDEERAKLLLREKQEKTRAELDQQIEYLKNREEEERERNRQCEKLLSLEAGLEKLKIELEKREKAKEKEKLKEYLVKQHSAKLRQKSREISENLEWEMSIADQIVSLANDKRKVAEDVKRFYDLLGEHKKLQKEREQEMEMLFQEEARQMWEKREAEWEKEKAARKKLLDQVIEKQRAQIREKLERARQEREAVSREQREVMDSIERNRKELEDKESREKMKKSIMKDDLLNQIKEKKTLMDEQAKTANEVSRQRLDKLAEEDKRHWQIEMERLKL